MRWRKFCDTELQQQVCMMQQNTAPHNLIAIDHTQPNLGSIQNFILLKKKLKFSKATSSEMKTV